MTDKMLIQIIREDVSQQVAQRLQPVVMLQRELPGNDGLRRIVPAAAKLTNNDIWYSSQQRVLEPAKHWSINSSSELIAVPLFDYLLSDVSAETLIRFGAQLGATVAATAATLSSVGELKKIFIVQGSVFGRPDDKPGCQVWAGYALCFTKE